jgi:hypothetical protein
MRLLSFLTIITAHTVDTVYLNQLYSQKNIVHPTKKGTRQIGHNLSTTHVLSSSACTTGLECLQLNLKSILGEHTEVQLNISGAYLTKILPMHQKNEKAAKHRNTDLAIRPGADLDAHRNCGQWSLTNHWMITCQYLKTQWPIIVEEVEIAGT